MALVYLDNNATTPIDPVVLDAMLPYLTHWHGNASSAHTFGWEAESAVELARGQVARLVGADPDEVFFTSGATEANNWFLQRFAHSTSRCIFTTPIEHKSVLQPLASLRDEVRFFSVDPVGRIDFASLGAHLRNSGATCNIVSLMGVNNEIHSVLDFTSAKTFCEKVQGIIFSDVTQMVGRLPVDMSRMGVGALSLSSHKLYGPKGVGALCVRRALHQQLKPLIEGGGQERGLRAGTTPVPLVVGFGMACEIARTSLDDERKRLEGLVELFLAQLHWHGLSFSIVGPSDLKLRQPGSLSLEIEGLRAERICELVPEVAVSQSSACNGNGVGSHVLRAIGLDLERSLHTFRLSFGRFNSEDDAVFAARRFSEAVGEYPFLTNRVDDV